MELIVQKRGEHTCVGCAASMIVGHDNLVDFERWAKSRGLGGPPWRDYDAYCYLAERGYVMGYGFDLQLSPLEKREQLEVMTTLEHIETAYITVASQTVEIIDRFGPDSRHVVVWHDGAVYDSAAGIGNIEGYLVEKIWPVTKVA